MKVLLTGANGFLGWHTRLRLRALTEHEVVPVGRDEWPDLAALASGVDAVVHVAGVNRGDDASVEDGNRALAADLRSVLTRLGRPVQTVYANSIQAGNGTPYGTGKAAAAHELATLVRDVGGSLVDVHLPNLFGEHGRPRYNSFVATFVDAVINGVEPAIADRPVDLLHVQGAAAALIDALTHDGGTVRPAATAASVLGVYQTLQRQNATYTSGDIPELYSDLDVDLFNTLRAARFPAHYPIELEPRSDERGRLVEVVRAHGGQGQTFVSTTRPGITRGEHFHLRKIERFVVVAGTARIALRRMFTDDGVEFDVDGDHPVAIDMPTGWAHNITNTGHSDLTTLFWTHELFDPAAPDTTPEAVGAPRDRSETTKASRP
ncbi:MAG: NAD-dependent epimerase/dehydratase [Actinotalea sp.]|nr:NAD-dependent epimerase/dehydratase [Actinotalea sp.]